MTKRRKDPSKAGLGAPNVKGQGTTETETGTYELDSARKKQRRANDKTRSFTASFFYHIRI